MQAGLRQCGRNKTSIKHQKVGVKLREAFSSPMALYGTPGLQILMASSSAILVTCKIKRTVMKVGDKNELYLSPGRFQSRACIECP